MPGSQGGIEYSIAHVAAEGGHTNYLSKNILKDDGKCWCPRLNAALSSIEDAIIVDMGGEHSVTALEIKNSYCAGRTTKRANIHGSLNVDGPWTLLLELSWEDPANAQLTTELHTIAETTMRFIRLEILESAGTYNPPNPAWEYLRALTGKKSVRRKNSCPPPS